MSNLHKEAQAREKWCPHARVLIISKDINGSGNRVDFDGISVANPEQARCIASECMAWQWEVVSDRQHAARAKVGCDKLGYCALTSQGGKQS